MMTQQQQRQQQQQQQIKVIERNENRPRASWGRFLLDVVFILSVSLLVSG